MRSCTSLVQIRPKTVELECMLSELQNAGQELTYHRLKAAEGREIAGSLVRQRLVSGQIRCSKAVTG